MLVSIEVPTHADGGNIFAMLAHHVVALFPQQFIQQLGVELWLDLGLCAAAVIVLPLQLLLLGQYSLTDVQLLIRIVPTWKGDAKWCSFTSMIIANLIMESQTRASSIDRSTKTEYIIPG